MTKEPNYKVRPKINPLKYGWNGETWVRMSPQKSKHIQPSLYNFWFSPYEKFMYDLRKRI